MSSRKSHESLVEGQFGSQAQVYLQSAVHAQGADLEMLVGLMHGHPDARVLDIGCGGGHVAFNVAPLVAEVVACDLSPEMLGVVADTAASRGLGNVKTQQGVAEKLPFEDERFDAVLTRFSAHHWSDFDAGLREAARVLKPGGTAVMVDSVAPGIPAVDTFFQAIEILRDCSHVRNRSRAEWEASLTRAGFVVTQSHRFRLRLDFRAWVERMKTPKLHVEAIRSLQSAVSSNVTGYFDTEADGSHTIDVALFEATKR